MAEHDDQGGTIGLDYFEEQLDPEMREIVQYVRKDLRALDLNLRKGRKRTAGRDELRRRLAEREPAFYDAMTDEGFEHVVLLADTWDVTEEIVAEQAAARRAAHPDGKWSLDDLRIALGKLKPGIYGAMDNGQIAAMLRKEGIPVQTIRIGGKTHKGIRQADVDRLFREREARRKGVTRP